MPRADGAQDGENEVEKGSHKTGGTETVLVVEDNESVRSFVRSVLAAEGYTLIESGCSEEALAMIQSRSKPIHLLLTDVVMPGISGPELAAQMAPFHPETKVLYMSGYADKASVHSGVLDAGSPFLQKPFMPETLTRKIREVMDK